MEDPFKLYDIKYDIKFNELTYQIHFLPFPKKLQKTKQKQKQNKSKKLN